MDTFKRALTILGSVVLILVITMVAVALWAINQKATNLQKVAPAMQNRWKPKPQPEEQQQPQANEERKNDNDTFSPADATRALAVS